MKANFKPLGLAAAVAAASAGYAGVANAQPSVANNGLGDLGLIPYYSVQDGYGTGIHVINNSARTQVVKFRFRRGSDSLDALDFNIVMSPWDEWTGFMDDTSGTIAVSTQDSTCTAPIAENGRIEMENIYRSGADEGYIEVIAMGSPENESTPLAVNAKHVAFGDPLDCQFVEDNFLDAYLGSVKDPRGIHNNALSAGLKDVGIANKEAAYCYDGTQLPNLVPVSAKADGVADLCVTPYEDGGDALKVSWFVRDSVAGLEFGNDAVHVAGFSDGPMMTHQETGVYEGNLRGFDFPDLQGSSPYTGSPPPGAFVVGSFTPELGKYNLLRDPSVLGVSSVLNDWSDNPELNVGTDWIITIPGQYTMLDLPLYFRTLGNFGGLEEGPGGVVGGAVDFNGDTIQCGEEYVTVDDRFDLPFCDWRDIPVRADFLVYDREENLAAPPPGDRDVVVSPQIPGLPPTATILRHEVNVVHWGEEVLVSDYDEVDPSGLTGLLAPAVSGWAKLDITSKTGPGNTPLQFICNWDGDYFDNPRNNPIVGDLYDPNDPMDCSTRATGQPPMIGFVAWERSFPANPDGNYGRAIAHSFESGAN
jgi:hypothetical protein